MGDGAVVITGGDGYVGSRVASDYLDAGDLHVVLVVRDPRKRPDVLGPLVARGATVHAADLSAPGCLDDLSARDVRHVVHAAAITRFNVDALSADAANVRGTAHVLEFARRAPRVESVGVLSTLYAAGLVTGQVAERSGAPTAPFANEYERSKAEAEALAAAAQDLPVRTLRLATVIADDESGRVSQRNAFHTTLRLVYYGLLSVVPGDPATPVPLVSGRFSAQAITTLMRNSSAAGVYHLVHQAERSVSLGDLLDLALTRFAEEDDFRRRRVLAPLFVDEASFVDLANETDAFGGAVLTQAMATMAPFARQLYAPKAFATDRFRHAVGLVADDPRPLATAAIDHIVTTRWGRSGARAA